MIVFANAKINIGLYVVSKRPDGYHNLETLFYPVPLFDAIEMVESDVAGLSVSGIMVDCPAGENIILKAYDLLKQDYNLPPVRFHLHKVIPYGAGLGGGSSNAASVLKMVNDYFNLQLTGEHLKRYAAKTGADCPFFIDNVPMFATGIGDMLSPVNIDLSGYRIVIVKPTFSVSTREAYKRIIPSRPGFNLNNLSSHPVEEWNELIENDFEKYIFPLYPEIKKLKETLYDLGAVFASMSGSGSSVFGIFNSVPEDLRKIIPEGILFTL